MPRHPQKSQYKEKDYRVVYLLRSPLSREFYIGQCAPDSLMPIFRQHCTGEREYTDKSCLALREKGLHPCLTVLEEVFDTRVGAYAHIVAWTKLFVDAGYTSLNTGNVLSYIEDMSEDAARVYDLNRFTNLKKICDCSACVVANYARQQCPKYDSESTVMCTRPKGKPPKGAQLLVRLPEEELDQIKRNAKACGKTVSAYVRETALDMCVLRFDYAYVTAHTNEISALRNAITSLIFTIKKRGEYVPVDIEYILERMDEISKLEKEFIKKQDGFMKSSKRLVQRTIQQIVNSKKLS